MEHILSMEVADADEFAEATSRDAAHQRESPAGHDSKHQGVSPARHDSKHQRESLAGHDTKHQGESPPGHDTKHQGLRHPAAGSDFRLCFDEQARVPVWTDLCLYGSSTALPGRNNGPTDQCSVKSARACDEQSPNPCSHQMPGRRQDQHSAEVSVDLPDICPIPCSGRQVLAPVHKNKMCRGETLSTSTRPTGCQFPVTEGVLCDTVSGLDLGSGTPPTPTQLDLGSDTTATQTQLIHDVTAVTDTFSIGKHSQITCFSHGPTLSLTLEERFPKPSHLNPTLEETFPQPSPLKPTLEETFPQPRCQHLHHQENSNHGISPRRPRHQSNNNHCDDTYSLRWPTCGYPKGRATVHANISEGLGNGWIPADISEDNDPLLSQPLDSPLAPPMEDKYHVYFSHCPQDRQWVEHIVEHLQSPPYNYLCAYTSLRDETEPRRLQHSALCSAMLSQWVVLVLSRHYVQVTWPAFEKTLAQLRQMSLHHQKVLGVLLEDCHIPESMADLYWMEGTGPEFLRTFTKRLQSNVSNGTILAVSRLQVVVGWNSYLLPVDGSCLDTVPSLSGHGIGMQTSEFSEIVSKVSGIVNSCNKLPWILSAQPLAALLLAVLLWLPAFIAILVIHVDDDSGIALPVRLTVFLFPLALVAGGYLIKWRRSYWMTKVVRLLVQNCVEVNQAFYFQGRPVFVTAANLRANMFSIYFVYFDATDCVRNVDVLLFTCMENDWDKLTKLITFYTRDANYLSRMSLSERLTVMMSAPYLVKLVKQMLPQAPRELHVPRLLCLCQFTEECASRFAHGLDREDVPSLAELFVRHMPGSVSGSAVRRVQEELFHASHGLVH